jgi:threonine aldolase
MVDLRSDTVTQPTESMRRAMAEAEVGDSLYGEDPTVNRLEEVFANRVGKEAALFVPSGTMANQIALRLHGRPGTIVLTPRRAHVVVHEGGAAAVNSPTQFHLLDDDDGEVDPAEVQWVIEASAHHQPEASLLWLENTHMPAAGAPWSLAGLKAVTAEARGGGLKVHLDGARLFNAEASTGTTAAEYSAQADTVMCCLSKGLCAPVGSVLAGSADDMARARAERQRLGGGMRQAGVIAAAGLVGLEQMIERLPEDHERAKRIADVVAERWPGSGCDPAAVRTNIVTWSVPDTDELIAHLRAEGVLAGTIAPGVMRLVTHHDVDDDGVERVRKALASAP